MNLRVYLRLLRPLPNLTWALAMSGGLSRFATLPNASHPSSANWLALAGLFPFCWGAALATAAHAGMHRPFFPLLPNAYARVRRETLVALTLSIAGTVLALHWIGQVSLLANLGLVSAMMVWPLCNRHTPRWQLWFSVPLIVVILVSGRLEHVLLSAPWIAGPLGIALAALAFWRGFRADRVRERAEIPFSSVGWSFSVIGNSAATRRAMQETMLARAKVGQSREITMQLPAFTGSTVSWMRLLWLSLGRFTFPRQQIVFAVIFALEAALLPLIMLPFVHVPKALYWQALLDLGRGTPQLVTHSAASLTNMSALGLGMGMVFSSLAGMPPRIIYPVSRARLGQVVFAVAATQLIGGLVAIAVAALGMCLLVQAITGEWLADGGIVAIGCFAFAMLPLLPLIALSRTFVGAIWRVLPPIAMGATGVVLASSRSFWITALRTPTGMLIQLGVTLLAFSIMYFRFRRYYSRCDLLHDLRLGTPMATAAMGVS